MRRIFIELNAFAHDIIGLTLLGLAPDVEIVGVAITPIGGWYDVALDVVCKTLAFCHLERAKVGAPSSVDLSTIPITMWSCSGSSSSSSSDSTAVEHCRAVEKRGEALAIMERKRCVDCKCLVPLCDPPVIAAASNLATSSNVVVSGDVAQVAASVRACLAKYDAGTIDVVASSGVFSVLAALFCDNGNPMAAVKSLTVHGGTLDVDANGVRTGDGKSCDVGAWADTEATTKFFNAVAPWARDRICVIPRDASNAVKVDEAEVQSLGSLATTASNPWPAAAAHLVGTLWSMATPLVRPEMSGVPQGIWQVAAAVATLTPHVVLRESTEPCVTVDAQSGAIRYTIPDGDNSKSNGMRFASELDAPAIREVLFSSRMLGVVA